ncbi:T9SS type A sorting domain-containing protein [Mesonia sp. K7]|uniref:T9SS type A sorting domain-containing protein n=1 Tax=Mesonia sp. K7 TaxID=2218606 RepID=UPI000DAAD412|nr:T9SS type A sorting domain-containing protein [Mesonia sp. K7]PZD77702.1 hypothetical protein DNG35_07645 [Mesonia sp. K7]
MKKITLLLVAFAATFTMNAQTNISFEASEGYTLGNIHNQDGWVVVGDGSGGVVQNQLVSDEEASDGTFSFKISRESAFPQQSSFIVGALKTLSTTISNTASVMEFDMFINFAAGADGVNTAVRFIASDDSTGPVIAFLADGSILVPDEDANGDLVFTDSGEVWTGLTWFTFKVELGTTAKYFLNGTEIYDGINFVTADLNRIRFAHDNAGTDAQASSVYMDNLTYSNTASNDINKINSFTHYVTNDLLNVKSDSTISNIDIYNLIGQKVNQTEINNTNGQVNIANLQNGVYVGQVTIDGQTKSFKFVKK